LYWNHPAREFHKFNGPYYKKSSQEKLREHVEELKQSLLKGERNVLKNKKIIANKDSDEIIGQVNWYWKSQETHCE
jgi:putative hydrolase of HD superfamily